MTLKKQKKNIPGFDCVIVPLLVHFCILLLPPGEQLTPDGCGCFPGESIEGKVNFSLIEESCVAVVIDRNADVSSVATVVVVAGVASVALVFNFIE